MRSPGVVNWLLAKLSRQQRLASVHCVGLRPVCTWSLMPELKLYQVARGLTPPWQVVASDFDSEAGELTIDIDFPRGSRFSCPKCGRADCRVYASSPSAGGT